MAMIVNGMDAPNYCYECSFHSNIHNSLKTQRWCKILNKVVGDEYGYKPRDCPIQQVQEGEWITAPYHGKECPVCHHTCEELVAHYCSWCGTKMKT